MNHLRHYGWLTAGALTGLTVALFDVAGAMSTFLTGIAPLPWARLGAALLLFGTFTALHFRQQLVAALSTRTDDAERSGAATRLIGAAVADGRRWLRVIQENLELVADGSQRENEARLYLEGARSHADKLEQAFERIEGTSRKLDES